jgi:hypothetical protein
MDAELKLKLHDLAIKESVQTSSHLGKLEWQSKQKGRLFIPLCYMMSLLAVRPFVKNNVSQLATYFITDGHMEGYGFFYVALEDNHGHINDVTLSVVAKWSTEWKEVNEEFEKKLLADNNFKIFFRI